MSLLDFFQRICLVYLRRAVESGIGLRKIVLSYGIIQSVDGVDGVEDLRQTFSLGIVGKRRGISKVEVGIKVEYNLLGNEGFSSVWNGSAVAEFTALHILKPFSAVKTQHEVLLLGCTLQHSRVGKDDGGIFVAVCHAIDHDAVELSCIQILLLHIEVAVRDSIVEDAFRDFQFRTLLLHGYEELCQLLVGVRTYIILEVEGTEHDDDGDDDERAESLHQRDAGSLDGSEL